MAKRFGGTYSPDGKAPQTETPRATLNADGNAGRASVLFVPAIPLVATSLNAGAVGLTFALIAAAIWTLAAWLLREGQRAEAEYNARRVTNRPAIPRKILSSALMGVGSALAVLAHHPAEGLIAPILLGLCTSGLHLAAFGLDPLRAKGMAGIDSFQQSRVARVVDEAEKHLAAMSDAIRRARAPKAEAGLTTFQSAARDLIRTVEEDPRDLTAARKFLGVYLQGARDATIKFADIYARSQDEKAQEDYLALLEDLTQNFAARNAKSLLEDRGDLNIEIDVLRERLSREGVRLDPPS